MYLKEKKKLFLKKKVVSISFHFINFGNALILCILLYKNYYYYLTQFQTTLGTNFKIYRKCRI